MKKLANLFLVVAMCLSLCACETKDKALEEPNVEEGVVEETTDENEESSNNEEITNSEETANNEGLTNVKETVNTDDSTEVDGAVNTEDATNVSNTESQKENTFEQYVFCREDFEIPDIYNTGYTNMIDFYNDYPNGKVDGTEGNLCLGIYYKYDVDLSFEESLAFKTYRDIGLGSSLDEVFDAYGTVAFEPPHAGCVGLSDEEHTLKYFVCYWAEIESGAYMDIRFYFDQNDTVMSIEYSAVHEEYASNINADTFEIIND